MALALRFSNFEMEAGTDEAGRGCLSGPVVAAAVILPKNFKHPLLKDSKKLTEKQRELLRPIIESHAVSYGVGIVDAKEIDTINILQASIKAMHQSLEKLAVQPDYIIVDGNKFNSYKEVPHTTIVKGDGKYLSIAAASVLAKTYRDEIMKQLHEEFPHFNWQRNKGYPTKEHREAIRKFGSCKYHRKSFQLLPEELKLNL
jgi:ribonuclease HII